MADINQSDDEFQLSTYLDLLLRRRWIVLSVMLMVLVSTALYSFTARPLYRATALLIIEKERGGGGFSNGTMVESNNDDYYQTQYKLLKSDSLLEKVYKQISLESTDDFRGGVGSLYNAVSIAPVLRSRLVHVRVDSHDPALAARIANELAKVYVEENLRNQLFISKDVLLALQLKGDSGKEARVLHESLPAVVNNSLIQVLKGEAARLRSQAADMRQRYTPKHPILASLESNLAALEAQIQTETEMIVRSLKTELSGQLTGNNVRIVDPAKVPSSPISPQKKRNMGLSLIGGFLLGLMVALMVETLDQSIRTQEDVENRLKLPFLGTIPFIPQGSMARVYHSLTSNESSLTSESFRNLRTMVDFAEMSLKAKRVLVTSAVQEEGKSYVAANLAVAFAQLGESVLLIDGDLRRPKVHKNFQLSSEHGISDFLASGRSVDEIGSLIQQTPIASLKSLPCGTRPPNPSELLNTPRVEALLNWIESKFDRVIVDCTPIYPIHDTLLWGRHIPSAIFVVRYGRTRTPLIKNAADRLLSGNMKVLGVVVNAATPSGLAYAAYGYYYHQYYRGYETASTPAGRAA